VLRISYCVSFAARSAHRLPLYYERQIIIPRG
jgi:hypothetical protein